MGKGRVRGAASLGSLGAGCGLMVTGGLFLGAAACLWVGGRGGTHATARPDRMAELLFGHAELALFLVPLLCIGAGLVVGGWRVVARELRHRRDCALARETTPDDHS